MRPWCAAMMMVATLAWPRYVRSSCSWMMRKLLAGHRVQVAVEAVDHHDACAALHGRHDRVRELARRQLGRVHLLHRDSPFAQMRAHVDAESVGAAEHRVHALVEDEHRGLLAARGGGRDELRRQRRLAGAGRAHDERARSSLDAAAQQRVDLGHAAGQSLQPRVGPHDRAQPAAEKPRARLCGSRSRGSRRETTPRGT